MRLRGGVRCAAGRPRRPPRRRRVGVRGGVTAVRCGVGPGARLQGCTCRCSSAEARATPERYVRFFTFSG